MNMDVYNLYGKISIFYYDKNHSCTLVDETPLLMDEKKSGIFSSRLLRFDSI
jgi:hypothetical protein